MNCRPADLVVVELLFVGLPVVPVVFVGLLFRIYRTAVVAALIIIALFLLMVIKCLGPYLFGEHAGDGAGIGLGAGLVFLWQWGMVLIYLVVAAIGSVIERNAFFASERRRHSVRIGLQAEQSHAPEPAAEPVSSGETAPPAR